METSLVAVTVLSLALAAAMGVMLTRMVREERRRSDARVTLLQQLAFGESASPARSTTTSRQPFADARNVAAPNASAPATADLDLHRAPPPDRPLSIELFDVRPDTAVWPRRMAITGGLALLAIVAAVVWSTLPAADVGTERVQPAAASGRPLELLSLSHSQEADTLTVSGVVQNPGNGAVHSRVQATVTVFDAFGAIVTSGRAPLDFSVLAAGDESPFVVRVPVSGAPARYRIGFRGSNDEVIAHVDRRDSHPSARKQVP